MASLPMEIRKETRWAIQKESPMDCPMEWLLKGSRWALPKEMRMGKRLDFCWE